MKGIQNRIFINPQSSGLNLRLIARLKPSRYIADFKMRIFVIVLLCALAPVFAQRGDRPGEIQAPPIPLDKVPPATILSPEESLKTLQLPPGFKIEIVAAEPLIEAPVAMAWHPNGSLYVLEMRGFMPNVEGSGEDKIPGRVKILTDTNGDGIMDKATVFADNLVMPRALALVRDGLLVAEPPNLWFFRDTNGDGKSDEKTLALTPYGGQSNVEHTANGLLWGRDNWIYSASYTNRIRYADGKWITEPSAAIAGRGQWGISQDDLGRFVFNSNSDYLRGDLVPSELLTRNPNYAVLYGLNVQLDRNQETFPARMNTGVNRGYTKGQLRDDGTLATFTAACAPHIYRGSQFEPKYYGMAFVCEPGGNFVRGSRISETNGVRTATNAFPKSEFLTSTEERFRPVNLYDGPDGALYVVDFHRGILQHKLYVTSYLRNQIQARNLQTPGDLGRIYRVVQEGRARQKIEPLPSAPPQLVGQLQNPNAWNRETAQRLLVESSDASVVDSLKKMIRSNDSQFAGMHALWTLHGLNKLDSETLLTAFQSKIPNTRLSGARIAAERISESPIREAVIKAADDSDPIVQLYVAFALGPVSNDKSAAQALVKILEKHPNENLFHAAAISGLHGKESAFKEASAHLQKFQTALSQTNSAPARRRSSQARSAAVKPLTPEEQELYNLGKETYTLTCAACHQPHGLGQEGLAPPLVESEWTTGSERRLALIILHGLRGPITVKGKQIALEMPPLGILEDKQIAGIMTYVRREWGHTASAVTEAYVKKLREEYSNRDEPWSEEDLLKFK